MVSCVWGMRPADGRPRVLFFCPARCGPGGEVDWGCEGEAGREGVWAPAGACQGGEERCAVSRGRLRCLRVARQAGAAKRQRHQLLRSSIALHPPAAMP